MPKKDNTILENRKNQILSLIRDFCSQKLDDEYFELSEKLIDKLGRKRNVPFMTGHIEIWAAAVIHALGSINFLFDKSFEPYTTIDEINKFFGTKKTSTGNKSKEIRDILKMSTFDNEFSTQYIIATNPFNKYVKVNGFIVKKDDFLE
jgi:hypothetical protein